jgi:hypothetical protein
MQTADSSFHAAIRRERRPLPAAELPGHELNGAPYRRWAAAVCAAEAKHAADDFWACVYRLGLAALFDRDDGFGGHEAPFRFTHETHAFAAVSWLCHLQAHESDRRGPWAAVRWNSWDQGQRREWFARRRHLWSGFVRQVERYRAARRQLAQPLAEISEDLATAAEPLCRSMAARLAKRS